MPADLTSAMILAASSAWTQVLQLGPYVAGGILLAALAAQLDLPRRWAGRLRGSGSAPVLGGACLGGLSPLCTFGTVPVLVELLHRGAAPGPALAFLIASSLLNPQLFIIMTGGLGATLSLAHVASTLLLSLPVGLLAQRLGRETFLHGDIQAPSPASPGFWAHLARLIEKVGLAFVIGVLLAAVIQTAVPQEWISTLLGAGRWYSVLIAGVLGVPFYACGGGAVPVIAGLLDQGMSPGAALAFFLAGPATRVTALAALGTLLNRRALIAYVAYVVAGAALAGTILNLVLGS